MFLEIKRISPRYSKSGNGDMTNICQDFSIFVSTYEGLHYSLLEETTFYKNIVESQNVFFLDACNHCIDYHNNEIDNFAECAYNAFNEIINSKWIKSELIVGDITNLEWTKSSYKNIDFEKSVLGIRIIFSKYNDKYYGREDLFELRCEIYIPIIKLLSSTFEFEKYNCLINEEIDIAHITFVDSYKHDKCTELKHKAISKPLLYDYIFNGFSNFVKKRGIDNCIQNKLLKKFCKNNNIRMEQKLDIEKFIKAEYLLLKNNFDYERILNGWTYLNFGNISKKYGIDFKECLYE